MREINESLEIPADGHKFNSETQFAKYFSLPDYMPYGLSQRASLTLTDCHLAVLNTTRKARLIGFEIARRTRPFFKRTFRGITLQGDPREFDIILSSIENEFDDALEIPSIMEVYQGPRYLLLDVLRTPLVAHKDFEDSSSTYLLFFRGYHEADMLQRS